MVDRNGIEPFLKACKALVPPTTLTAHLTNSSKLHGGECGIRTHGPALHRTLS